MKTNRRNDMTPFTDGQVLLLKNGSYVLVMSVDPETRLNKGDNDRIVNTRFGTMYRKGKLGDYDMSSSLIVEDARNDQTVIFDIRQNRNMSITELNSKVAIHLGVLNPDIFKKAKQIAADMYR